MTVLAKPDLDLLELSLWLADLKGDPVVAWSLQATIISVRKIELDLSLSGWLQFNYTDKVVIVAELLDGWEVSVLLFLDWHVRIWVSHKRFGSLVLENTSKDTFGYLAQSRCIILLQFYKSWGVTVER